MIGGRYDGLMAQLCGQALSGLGFGLGVDRTLPAWHTEGPCVGEQARCEVFCVPLGEAAKPRLVTVAWRLRSAGINMDLTYGGRGGEGAMKAADRSGARYAIVLWECDLTEGAARLKDLGSGEQRAVPLAAVTREALGR